MKRLILTLALLLPLTTTGAPQHFERCETCQRDAHGHIQRSATVRREFMRKTGYPKGRKGYVIDHIVPLACGGRDAVENMQWQTRAEAKEKDKAEGQCSGGSHVAPPATNPSQKSSSHMRWYLGVHNAQQLSVWQFTDSFARLLFGARWNGEGPC